MNRTCELCDNEANKSSVIGDVYYRNLCMTCYAHLTRMEGESSGAAAYNRARDLEEHEADIRQPYNGDKIDYQFAHLYPETAKKMFSEEELRDAERS